MAGLAAGDVPLEFLIRAVERLVDWFYAVFGGGWMAAKSRSKACRQGQDSGRRIWIRRALEAIRAGRLTSLVRMVPVRALVKVPAARIPAVRVRL